MYVNSPYCLPPHDIFIHRMAKHTGRPHPSSITPLTKTIKLNITVTN